MPEEATRVDKWLWSVRLFKTRSQATQACRNGNVKIDDQPVKPSREIAEGMLIDIRRGPIHQTIKVLAPLSKRVGARLVPQYMQDLTPEEEYKTLQAIKAHDGSRPHGRGRPTKKERRDLSTWFGWD